MGNNKTTRNSKNTSNNKKSKNSETKNNYKLLRINDEFGSQNFIYTKKVKTFFIVVLVLLALLVMRLGYLQFVDGSYLKERAYRQQSINQIISPKRGTIYDSTGMILATSASVDTITINPELIKDSKNDESRSKELKEKVAKAFSDIFELDYDEILEKVNSTAQVETIIKKVEQDKVEQLKEWMKENEIYSGINIDEDTKRYYPYGSVLSQVLGTCGSDSQGLSGIEFQWNSTLSGTPGKIVSSKSGGLEESEIPKAEETYIAAENGSNLTLTIDFNIQTVVEKYLKQVVDDNNVENGGSCIIMNPKNGDILAMATYPNYDLNNPFSPNEQLADKYESLENNNDKMNLIFKMWSNKSISELYDPGSIFKLVTASIALEENITSPNIAGDFYCDGYEVVDGKKINCWSDIPHRAQTLTQALENSCNPAFIQLGSRIGTPTLYKYFKTFGLFDKTGIDLPGEAVYATTKSISEINNIDRSSMSFGQGISITPLQMITSVSAIANDGIMMRPRIVKSITNVDTGAITTIEPEEIRQVISSDTSEKVREMMLSVVENGTGKNGAVTGYTIGGKTGTSENLAAGTGHYIASYCAISPVEDTQVVVLLTLYDPPEYNYHGGTLAGPAVSQMLTQILPNLGIPSDEETVDDSDLIIVPDIRNKTIAEAEKILSERGFTSKITTENDKNSTVVTDQVPKPGAALSEDSIIMLYDQDSRTSTTVPDLLGKSKYQATQDLQNANLNISSDGTGTAVSQDPPKGSIVDAGTVVKVTFK